jgi:hypothetical protein
VRVQLTFWLQVVTYWGVRPGETTEGSNYRGSNEGLHYGDFSLSLARTKEGPQYRLKIQLRNRKGKRESEGQT